MFRRHRGQRREGARLRLAVDADRLAIPQQQRAPGFGKRRRGDDRRQDRRRAPAGIHDEAAALEQREPDAGARAAIEPRRVGRDVARQASEFAHRRADRQRELRARSQTRVRRHRARDLEPQRPIHRQRVANPRQRAARARRLRAGDLGRRGFRQREPRRERVDREADRAKSPSEFTVEIEEAEMQPPWVSTVTRRNRSSRMARGPPFRRSPPIKFSQQSSSAAFRARAGLATPPRI